MLPPALAALPLELLPALRMPHVTSVGRVLSVSVLAKRLGHADGATCKKGSVGYAVDPRDEVTLPADAKVAVALEAHGDGVTGVGAQGFLELRKL